MAGRRRRYRNPATPNAALDSALAVNGTNSEGDLRITIGWLATMMLFAGTSVASAQPAPDTTADADAAVATLTAFHSALTAGQPERARSELGATMFMADERTAARDRLRAHLYLTGERLDRWPANYLSQVGPYANSFRVVSRNIRGDAAVLITRDTGSNGFRRWTDEEVAWFLGRSDGKWRIVSMIIRDIQLPQ